MAAKYMVSEIRNAGGEETSEEMVKCRQIANCGGILTSAANLKGCDSL